MKKLLTLAALLGAASLSFGQGYVGFFNTSTYRVSTNGTTLSGFTSGAAGSWYYALLVAPSTQNNVDASLTGWTFSGLYATNTTTVGRFNGSNSTDGTGVGPLPAPYAPSTTADFVIVAWSANLGSDWTAVFNGRPASLVSGIGGRGTATWTSTGGLDGGWYTISTVANDIAVNALGAGYINVIGPAASGQISGMALNYYIVPEPTSFALAGLGAAALMIFRRRK